jgi:short-subunit dehydrogenase
MAPWALVAGGSEGIGLALAGYLAEAGINIVLVARKVEPLEEVAADLRLRIGVEVLTVSLDLPPTTCSIACARQPTRSTSDFSSTMRAHPM